jgi:hypothetical protein
MSKTMAILALIGGIIALGVFLRWMDVEKLLDQKNSELQQSRQLLARSQDREKGLISDLDEVRGELEDEKTRTASRDSMETS